MSQIASPLSVVISAELKPISDAISKVERDLKTFGSVGGKNVSTVEAQIRSMDAASASAARSVSGLAASEQAAASGAARAAAAMQSNVVHLNSAANAARLTSSQMRNLSRQGNDVITMFALGASPMQIFASQAGQVYGALQEGPGGLRGGIKALGNELALLATRWGPLALGAGAVATATYLIWNAASGPEAKAAEDALKGYKALIDSLEDGYRAAADAADEFYSRSSREGPNVALADIQGTAAEIQASLAREIETLTARTQGFITSFKDLSPAVLEGQQRIRDLGRQLAENEITAAQFREEIAKIRINPDTPRVVVEVADKLLDGSVNARDLANALDAVGAAAEKASEKTGRLRIPSMMAEAGRFGGVIEMMKRLLPEEFKSLSEGLTQQADEIRGSTMSAEEYAKSVRDRSLATRDAVVGLQLELKTLGMPAAEAAALRFEYEHITEAKRAAAEAGMIVDPEELNYIREAAGRVGEFTAAIEKAREAKQRLERVNSLREDMSFDRGQLFRSDADQQIASRLKGTGLGLDSVEAAYLRQTETLKSYRDMNREAWSGIGTDIVQNGVKPLEAVGNAMKGLRARLMDKAITGAADSLFNAVFGDLNFGLSIPTQETVGLTAANAMWVRSADGLGMGAAPLGAVTRGGPLAPIANDNAIYREAIAAIESRGSGGYSAIGPSDPKLGRALGRYQIMEANIAPWSRAALGRELTAAQFMANPSYQDAIFDHRFGGYVDRFGPAGAAQAWFGGPGSVGKLGRSDVLGTSVGEYGEKFNAALEQLGGAGTHLATSAMAFAGGFDATLNQRMLSGVSGIVDQFVPGLGSLLESVLQAGGQGGGGLLGGLFGGPAISAGARSAILSGTAGVGLFAGGGIATRPSIFGEAGPEAAVPLPDGRSIPVTLRMPSYVMPQAAPAPAPRQPVKIDVHNYGKAQVEVEERDDGMGGVELAVILDRQNAANIRKTGSRTGHALKQRGVRPPLKVA